MVTEEFVILLPRQFLPASSATEPLPPDFADCPIELPEASRVRRTSVILVVASELGIEGLLLLVHGGAPGTIRLFPSGQLLWVAAEHPPLEPWFRPRRSGRSNLISE